MCSSVFWRIGRYLLPIPTGRCVCGARSCDSWVWPPISSPDRSIDDALHSEILDFSAVMTRFSTKGRLRRVSTRCCSSGGRHTHISRATPRPGTAASGLQGARARMHSAISRLPRSCRFLLVPIVSPEMFHRADNHQLLCGFGCQISAAHLPQSRATPGHSLHRPSS